MRPYIAIVVDSFREALSSRVLWLLLGIITLVLLALAPLGVSFPIRTMVGSDDIRDTYRLAQTLKRAGRKDDQPTQRLVWDKLKKTTRESVAEIADSEERDRRDEFRLRQALIEEWNEAIKSNELFTDEELQQFRFDKEGRQLLEKENRTDLENQRLSRLALNDAFRKEFRPLESQALLIHYLGMDVMDPIPANREMMTESIKATLAGFTSVIIAPFGVLIAVLVTASIIPNMFDVGSVNLLFSKPIVRAFMYLSKFLGGLSFVLINAAYLIVGMWLIVGLRFGVWHQRFLLVIPILLFIFAIYYSVSAFTGMVWRNTIIAVASAICLWGICFAVGLTYIIMDQFFNQPRRIVRAVATGEGVMTVAENGDIGAWSEKDGEWKPALVEDTSGGPPAFVRQNSLLGPIYDADNQRILAIDRGFSSSDLLAGYAEREWERESIATAPGGCIAFLQTPSGEFLVVEREGISKYVETGAKKNLPIRIFGFNYDVGPKRTAFQPVGPKNYDFTSIASVATMNPDDGSVVLYGDGEVHRLAPTGEDGRFQLAAKRELLEDDEEAILTSTGDFVAVIDESATVHLLDKDSLDEVKTLNPFRKTSPRFVDTAKGGRYLIVVCHNKRVFAYDLVEGRDLSRAIPGQGNITTASFSGESTVLVADRVDRVREVNLAEADVTRSFSPKLTLFSKVFHWVVTPIHVLLPNPGDLSNTSDYLLTDKNAVDRSEDTSLVGAKIQFDPWQPVYKGAAFIGFMLLAACVYIHWQEF